MSPALHIAMLAIHSSPAGRLGTRDTGGMSVYVRETARQLTLKGHHVDMFTCAESHGDPGAILSDLSLIQLGRGRFSHLSKGDLPACRKGIFDCLERYRRDRRKTYDLVHSHYWISALVGEMAAKQWGCPHVTMFHTLGAAKNALSADEKETPERVAFECRLAAAAATVVPAERERHYLAEYCQADPRNCYVVPCGVDLDHFRPVDRKAAKTTLGIDFRHDTLLYVGRFAPVKGLDRLIEAVACLKRDLPNLRLVVVGGDGPQAASTRSVRARVNDLGIQNRVRLVGRVDPSKLPLYYSAADLFVLPSRYESFGLVVLEALACGTPVLATPVGAMETIIVQGRNGDIAKSPQQDALARGIAEQLAARPNQRPSQEAVRATVLTFGWGAVADQLESVYQDIVGPPFSGGKASLY